MFVKTLADPINVAKSVAGAPVFSSSFALPASVTFTGSEVVT